MTIRVLAVLNSATSGPRRLTPWLAELGIEVVDASGPEGELPDSLGEYAGLILLGGGLMPDDDERADWLARERALTKEAIDRDLPTLGICLGAQVIAHVAGGEVRANTGPVERGATTIMTTPQGQSDAATRGLDQTPMIENHRDMITALPPGAVHLARSEGVEFQAFRLGQGIVGVQFHPEVQAEELASWRDATLEDGDPEVDALIADARRVDAASTAAARAILDAFAEDVLRFHAASGTPEATKAPSLE